MSKAEKTEREKEKCGQILLESSQRLIVLWCRTKSGLCNSQSPMGKQMVTVITNIITEIIQSIYTVLTMCLAPF